MEGDKVAPKVEAPKVEAPKAEAPKAEAKVEQTNFVKRAFLITNCDILFEAADETIWREKHLAEAQNKALGKDVAVITHKKA
jgi:hypothetical protein